METTTATNPDSELRAREERRARLRGIINGSPSDSDCITLSSQGNVPSSLCTALVKAIQDGRTTPASRKELRGYLKDRGYFRLRGYIVARHEENFYEIYRYGRRIHALLKTTLTAYTTRGRFSLWAKRIDRRQIDTKNGFKQTWDVFEEDAFGSIVQKIFNARAGDPTSEAARRALLALLVISY